MYSYFKLVRIFFKSGPNFISKVVRVYLVQTFWYFPAGWYLLVSTISLHMLPMFNSHGNFPGPLQLLGYTMH